MRKTYRLPAVLAASGLLFLLLVNALLQMRSQVFVFPDSKTYLESAQSFYWNFEPNSVRPMLLALLNGLPLLFGFGDQSVFHWSYFLNAACWLGTISLLFAMLKSVVRERSAFVISLVYISCIGSAILVFHLLSESIYTFFLMLSVFLLMLFTQTKSFKFLSLSLMVLALSVLIKPGSMILLLLGLAFFIRTIWRSKRKASMIFLAIGFAAIIFQMAMMKQRFGSFTVSYIDSFTCYNYLATRADCLKTGEPFRPCDNARYRHFVTLSGNDQKTGAKRDMVNQLQFNSGNLAKAYFTNVFINSTHGSAAISECKNVRQTPYFYSAKIAFKVLSKLQIIFLSLFGLLAGIYWLVKSRRDVFTLASAIIVLYIIGISGISSDEGDRFHIVIYPFALLLIAKFLKERKWIS